MKEVICVTELVTNMINEMQTVMRGTKFEDNWYFNHDALTQLSNRETKQWMNDHGYLKHWLTPMLDLQKGTVYHES